MLLENPPPPPHNFSNGPSLIEKNSQKFALLQIGPTNFAQLCGYFKSPVGY